MRTTVTLDPDVASLVHEAMHRTRRSFKETLNSAVRAGLRGTGGRRARRFVVKARPMGLRAGIDPLSLNRLADDLEIDAALARPRRRARR